MAKDNFDQDRFDDTETPLNEAYSFNGTETINLRDPKDTKAPEKNWGEERLIMTDKTLDKRMILHHPETRRLIDSVREEIEDLFQKSA